MKSENIEKKEDINLKNIEFYLQIYYKTIQLNSQELNFNFWHKW